MIPAEVERNLILGLLCALVAVAIVAGFAAALRAWPH